MIAAMTSIGQAQGGEVWLVGWLLCAAFYFVLLLLWKTIRQAQTPKTLSSGFLQLSAAMT